MAGYSSVCADCKSELFAVGGGGDHGLSIGGYEDANGTAATNCAGCTDSLLCAPCSKENAYCPFCVAVAQKPCADCAKPVGYDGANLGLWPQDDGTYVVIGPEKWICRSCVIVRAKCPPTCEECRVSA